jgi:predicted secreted hydrolase
MRSSALLLAFLAGLLPGAFGQYKQALSGYRYEFPRDHFNHEEFQTEWWYTTGNLWATDGHRYGFELTFFRQGVDRNPEKSKSWDVQDIYAAHLALSDLDGERFFHAERTNRAGPSLAGVDEKTQRIWNGNWELRWTGENEIRLRAMDDRFSFELSLQSAKPPVIHGENGVSQKAEGPGHASHYISFTRLLTSGTLEIAGKRETVRGTGWMDHEFFTNQLGTQQIGWNWLSMQLDDNTEVMLYQFRHRDGSLDPYSSGTYADAKGNSIHLKASDFTLVPTGQEWTSAQTAAKYPVSWIAEIPKLGLKLNVTTPLKSQEFAGTSELTPNYWEGAISVEGTRGGQKARGVGYLEMTGYDQPFKIGQ